MLSFKAKIPKKQGGSLQPILPLIPTTVPISEDDKGSYLSFKLKTRIGQPDAQSRYKKYVRKFNDGGLKMLHVQSRCRGRNTYHPDVPVHVAVVAKNINRRIHCCVRVDDDDAVVTSSMILMMRRWV